MVSETGLPVYDATTSPRGFWRQAAIFVAIGLALYAMLLVLAERQVRATGERNPLFQIANLPVSADVVVLGASHAMPLGFEGIETALEDSSGRDVTVLAIEGAGVLPNAFIADVLLRRSQPQTVVYAIDSFAFLSRQWNEERVADNALFARAPYGGEVLSAMMSEPAVWPVILAYLSGFDKVNALLWPEPDRSEAELTKFDRTYRANARIDDQRVAYLFPPADATMLAGYLDRMEALATQVQASGAEMVFLLIPAPPRYRDRLPASHDQVMAGIMDIAGRLGIPVIDHESLLQEDENYYDTDHLNRAGATAYVIGPLADVLRHN